MICEGEGGVGIGVLERYGDGCSYRVYNCCAGIDE